MLDNANAPVITEWVKSGRAGFPTSIQIVGITSAGDGACEVDVEVSNDGETALDTPAFTVSLTLDQAGVKQSGGQILAAKWNYFRLNLKSVSGTDVAINAFPAI